MQSNYHYQRKNFLPLREAVILHLEPFSSYANPYDMPEATCQEEMSRLLSASRGNLSRVMNELKREGYLDDMRAHVPIGKLRRKTYVLTEVGMREARSLRNRTGNKKIRLRDESGDVLKVKVGDIPRELRDGSSILDIALNVRRGVFDKQAYLERIKRESEFASFEEDMPRVKYFFGREDDREEIAEWFESDTEKLLEIKGVAGIGKTALVATAFDELKENTNAIWLSLSNKSTIKSILEQVAALLNLLGRKRMGTYLKSHETISKEEILYIALEEFKDLKLLFVLDACEKVSGDLAVFIRFMIDGLRGQEGAKAILVGRSIPKLYDKSTFKKQGILRSLALKKLDYESSKKILQLKGVESWRQREAYDRTGGLPLFLDLVEPAHEFATTGIEEYLEKEVLSELERDEMRLLKIMSTFYQPVHSDAFYLWKGVKHSTVRSLVEKSLLFEVSPMVYDTHDILRDSVAERLGKQTKRNYHKKAAQFHQEQDGVEAIVQASFHLIDAGAIKEAVGLLTDNGREIVAKGHSEDLYSLLQILESERSYPDVSELAFLMGECLAIRGSWDKATSEYERYGSLSEKGKDLLGVSASLRRIAGIQRKRGYNREALKSLEKSVEISEKANDLEGLADSYYNMAATVLRMGDLKRSQSYVDKCLETAEISGNLAEIAKAYQIYGVFEEKLGKNKEALRIKRKTVKYAKESGDLHLLNESYTGLGVAYYKLEKNDEALESYEKALESARTTGDVRGTAYSLLNMASVYIEKPNLVKAQEYLDESLDILQVLGERRAVASTYLSYGFIHKMRGDWTKAEQCFRKNIDLVKEIGNPTDLYESYKTIGQILIEKFPRKGLKYLKKATAVADAIDETSLRTNLKSEIEGIISETARKR